MSRKTAKTLMLFVIAWAIPSASFGQSLDSETHVVVPAPGVARVQEVPTSSDYESLVRRFRELEQRTQELETRNGVGNGRTDTQAISHGSTNWLESEAEIAPLTPASTGKPTLNINGRIHLDTWSFTNDSEGIHFFENPVTGVDPEDRIVFRRIRLKFEGDVNDNMFYRMQLDLHSPDDGEMKDVYIGFRDLPFVQKVQIGNQKRPLGLDHLNSSRFNVFIERPLVVEAFNEDARRLGVAAYAVNEDESVIWAYGLYALENMVDDGGLIGDSRQMSVNGRLASSPWYDESSDGRSYFHWAVSGMVARPDGDADIRDRNRNEGRFRTRAELRSDSGWLNTFRIPGAEWYEILGAESMLNIGRFQAVGEYQVNWMQRDNTTPRTGPDLFFHGAYVYVAYMLTGEHVPYNRKSGTIGRVKPFENFFLVDRCNGESCGGWGAWQLALRYSYLDLTDQDIAGGIEHNVTAGLVWYFNANSSMQFNAIYGDIRGRAPASGFTDGHFTAIGTRLRVNF